jgi:hypothetical protein
LDLLNTTPIDYYCKKQSVVETAMYGSEFCAAHTCVERSVNLRNTLRYLGVPVRDTAFMFGDNKAAVDSSSTPHIELHKRRTALSFHQAREAIASGIIRFVFILSEENEADILSKHWGFQRAWPLLRVLLYQRGDTATREA